MSNKRIMNEWSREEGFRMNKHVELQPQRGKLLQGAGRSDQYCRPRVSKVMSANSPPSKTPRIRHCVFRKKRRSQSECEGWLLLVDFDPTAPRCTTCASTFTVKFYGINAVMNHTSTQKHQQKIRSSKRSAVLTKLFTPSSAEDEITAA